MTSRKPNLSCTSPSLASACPQDPTLEDLIALATEADTQGSIVGLADGALIARSGDGTTLGVSADFVTWRQVPLPDAVRVGRDAGPYAQEIVSEFTGAISLLTLEDRVGPGTGPGSGGCQVRWWRSPDGGSTWSTGPLGRPFSTCAGATWTFGQLLDGSVVLFSIAIDRERESRRGELLDGHARKAHPVGWVRPAPERLARVRPQRRDGDLQPLTRRRLGMDRWPSTIGGPPCILL